jgi:hypothetical protein
VANNNYPNTQPFGFVYTTQSFPNSGTSYTLHAIRELTNTTTATNYGLEGEIRDEESVPVFPGDSGLNGPYLELRPGRTTSLPKLILTKTHCGGYNTILDPTKYILSSRTFLRWCLTGKRGVYSSSSRSSSFGATPSIESHPVHYHKDVVKRVVHLIRNPLDNVVARFHNERNKFVRMQDEEWLKEYPNNKRGFRVCRFLLCSHMICFLLQKSTHNCILFLIFVSRLRNGNNRNGVERLMMIRMHLPKVHG